MFTKFIADGKVTIRLIQPCHDLIIQSDSIQLKSFLRILNQIINRHSQHDVLINQYTVMPNVFFNSNQFSLGKVKVVVKKKSEYPTLQGFPRTTEQLILSGLSRKSFDRQILHLQSLRILDLSDNNISYLPKELGTLPHLQQLLLSQNNLGKSPRLKWKWLEQTAIKHNLHFLDISSNSVSIIQLNLKIVLINKADSVVYKFIIIVIIICGYSQLTELPIQIRNLNALVHLKVSQNALTHLPHNIRTLRNLRILDVAKNRLLYLPVTITHLRLQLLDITENSFTNDIKNYVYGNDSTMTVRMKSLVEWSAKSILKSRFLFSFFLFISHN